MSHRAERLGLQRKNMQDLLQQLASAIVITDHSAMRSVEASLATGDLELLLCLDAASYDEPPMEVKTKEVVFEISEQQSLELEVAEGRTGTGIMRVRPELVSTDTGPTKLFQTAATVAMLARSRPTQENPSGKYLFISGHLPGSSFSRARRPQC